MGRGLTAALVRLRCPHGAKFVLVDPEIQARTIGHLIGNLKNFIRLRLC